MIIYICGAYVDDKEHTYLQVETPIGDEQGGSGEDPLRVPHETYGSGGREKKKIAAIQVEAGKAFTHPELMDATEKAAKALYQQGVRKGDVVCLCVCNTILYGPLVYGTLHLGTIASMVSTMTDVSTLAYYLKTNNAKVVLGMRFFQKQLAEAVALVEQEIERKINVLYPEELYTKADAPEIPAEYDGLKDATLDDTVAILFSSGTGRRSKGCVAD
ncbi:AMP-binding enzyme, putative [Leishmania shawi]|uniref:AMP-binding enzyme n=1 Tax=Leishmania shawi TaxID=5680 RepID=A0ABR3EHK1_9TRYP